MNNLEKIKANLASVKDARIIDKGAWSEKTTLFFENSGLSNSAISSNGGFQIQTEKIDNVCENEKVSMLKMDIEGAELEALKGAEKTIIRDRPVLAICVYHKEEDLITIPQYIRSLHHDYKLYIRHYGPMQDETVLYAV
jgi:FkbM family methyltransferase